MVSLLLVKWSLAVFEFVHTCTKINVRFHLGCVSPHVFLYHVNGCSNDEHHFRNCVVGTKTLGPCAFSQYRVLRCGRFPMYSCLTISIIACASPISVMLIMPKRSLYCSTSCLVAYIVIGESEYLTHKASAGEKTLSDSVHSESFE
jgi:hypothetical protein